LGQRKIKGFCRIEAKSEEPRLGPVMVNGRRGFPAIAMAD
jgi:hypothetical protein